MDWNEIVRTRRMCRDYEDRPVDTEVLDRILDQARRVPTAGFSQGIDFVVLEGAQTATFWDHTLPESERQNYEKWAEQKIRKVSPLGRWQEAGELAAMAVFLASPHARNITGQTINIDGGQVMHS